MPIDINTNDVYARASLNFISAIADTLNLPPGENSRLRDCVLDNSTVERAPSSLNSAGAGNQIIGLEDHLKYLEGLKAVLKYAVIEPFDIVTGPGPRAIVQAKTNGASGSGRPYCNDIVFFIDFVDSMLESDDDTTTSHMNQGGVADRCGLPKVRRWKEFVDSAFMKDFLAMEEIQTSGREASS